MNFKTQYNTIVLNPSDPPCILKSLDSFPTPYKVEIGTGENPVQPLDEWIHTDPHMKTSSPSNHIEILCYSYNTPFDDNSVSILTMVGVWEHFRYDECKVSLDEWYRILQPFGTILFNFPPVDHALKLFFNNRVDFPWVSRAVYGHQRYKGDEHKSGWTYDYIQKWMEDNYKDKFDITEIFWGDSRRTKEEPLRFSSNSSLHGNAPTVWDYPGGHVWVRLRKK